MNLESMLYIEVDLMCVIIVGIVLYQVLHDIGRSSETRFLVIFNILAIAFFLSDMVWFYLDGGYAPCTPALLWGVNIVYFTLSVLMVYSWFLYSESVQHNSQLDRPIVGFFTFIPALLVIVAAISSPWTGALFTIGADGTYARGVIYPVQPIVLFLYVAFSAIKALVLQNRVPSYAERRRYQTLASFVVIPAICGGLQFVFYGLDLIYPGIAISVLWVYIDLQHQQVSLDPLTQVNNRSQLMKQFGTNIRRNFETMFLMMVDADDFKSINDRFGHLSGDRALVRIAKALKQSAQGRNCFIARYGGDEFVVVCNTADPEDIEQMMNDIESNLAALNESENTGYDVRVSVGVAQWGPTTGSMRDLVAAADAHLYEVKQARKAAQIATETNADEQK